MRILRLFVIAASLATFGGCFQATTLVNVNGDGSGTIEQTMLLTGAALAQLRQFAAFGGSGGKEFDPFSEEQARNAAASIGANVTYVSSTPIATTDGQGRSILYSFTDVSQLHINQQPPAPGGVNVRPREAETSAQNIRLELTHQPNGHAVLHILLPEPKMSSFGGALGAAGGPNKPSPEQVAMMKRLLAGARVAIAVQPEGRLVKTSSPWVEGQKVTLLAIDFDEIMKDDTALERLQGANNADDLRALMKDIPGLKVSVDREVTIEFTPKQ